MITHALWVVAQDTDPNTGREPARLVVEGPTGTFGIADLRRKVLHTDIRLSTFQRHGAWFRVEEDKQRTIDLVDFRRTNAQAETEPAAEGLGKLIATDASWEPKGRHHSLEALGAEYKEARTDPFRVFVLGSDRRSAEQICNRLVSAMSVDKSFHGTVWTRDHMTVTARTVTIGNDAIDARRFESASLDAVVLSGGEEPSDLPADRFGNRRGFAVIGGVHKKSAMMVRTMLDKNASAVYLADPVTGHTWQVGEREPHLGIIVGCIKTLYDNPLAKTRATNLFNAALAGLSPEHHQALIGALDHEKIGINHE